MSAAKRAVAVAIVPMVAVTVWLGLASEHLERPVASALHWSHLTAAPMAIGLYWWVRRPASRFGPLLVGFGILAWIVSWESSDWPPAFDVGVLAEGPTFWLTFYLFLAFPMGRLEPAAARWLMAALALAVGAFFLPWALFSPVIAGGGPLTRCAPNCPENVLQLGSAPGLVEVAGKAETYSALAITVAVLVFYVLRLRAASRPQRRALTASPSHRCCSCRRTSSSTSAPGSFTSIRRRSTRWRGASWPRVLLPLGFLIALLQAERFAARALHSRSSGSRLGPSRSNGATRSRRRWTVPPCGWPTSTRTRGASGSPMGRSSRARPAGPAARGCRSTEAAARWRRC